MEHKWLTGTVIPGNRLGRKKAYPTINLPENIIPPNTKKGVYLAKVKIEEKEYFGVLFFGPRLVLGENSDVLEINLLDFDEYLNTGKRIAFKLIDYIREVKPFLNFSSLKEQITKDKETARKLINKNL